MLGIHFGSPGVPGSALRANNSDNGRGELSLNPERIKMGCTGAFILQPSAIFGVQLPSRLCCKAQLGQFRRQRSSRLLRMTAEDSSSELQVSIETLLNDNSELESPEFIDVGDGDVEDDDADVLGALGSDLDLHKEKRKKTRKRTWDFVEEINVQPDSFLTSDADRQPPIEEDETAEYVRTVVRAADQRKAEDIVAMRVSKLTYISSFVIIATGNNSPQIRAIGNLIEDDLAKKHSLQIRRRDGTANSGWLLLDYGDFLVNVFTPEQRAKYNLEGLWKNGEEMDISDCLSGPDESAVKEKETTGSLDDWLD